MLVLDERHQVHRGLASDDEDAFCRRNGRDSGAQGCRAGRHFRVPSSSRKSTSVTTARARRGPGSSRSSPCGWCSKLCSERVGKRQIGTRQDKIAIGRFSAGNRESRRNSREADRALVGLANRRFRPLSHLTARLQVYGQRHLRGNARQRSGEGDPPFKPSPLTLNATTNVLCIVGMLLVLGTPSGHTSGHTRRFSLGLFRRRRENETRRRFV
jgi:hypothetical protein